MVDFRNKAAMLTDNPERGWIPLKQSGRGHLLLELIPKIARATFDEALFGADDLEQWDIETAGSYGTTDEDDGTSDEDISDAYLTSSCYLAPAHDVGEIESDDTTNITRRQRTALMQAVTQHLEEALALREARGGAPETVVMWQVGDKEPRFADVVFEVCLHSGQDLQRGDRLRLSPQGRPQEVHGRVTQRETPRGLFSIASPSLGDGDSEGQGVEIFELCGQG